jgi:hypothetical protein
MGRVDGQVEEMHFIGEHPIDDIAPDLPGLRGRRAGHQNGALRVGIFRQEAPQGPGSRKGKLFDFAKRPNIRETCLPDEGSGGHFR